MKIYKAAAQADKHIAAAPPVKNGRVELIHYIKEQSIALDDHRFGCISDVAAFE